MIEEKITKGWATLFICAVGAGLVFWLFIGGGAIEAAIVGKAGREAIISAIWTHVGWGMVTAPLILVYAAARFSSVSGARNGAGVFSGANKASAYALCALLLFLVITGPIVVWTYGSDLKVFDLFTIPTPTGKVPVVHDPLEIAHAWGAKAAPWLAGADLLLFASSRILGRR